LIKCRQEEVAGNTQVVVLKDIIISRWTSLTTAITWAIHKRVEAVVEVDEVVGVAITIELLSI